MDSSGSLPEANVSFSRDDDFVVVSKPKTGVAFVEARVKDDFQAASTEKGFQQIQARLERALNDPELEGTVISLGSDLLKDPTLIGRFPHGMFDTVYVVEFQGMSPGVKFVQAKNVDLRVHVYRFASHDLAPLDCPSESMLPSTQLDGLWELC